MTASLFKSPELFPVFWSISIALLFRQSPLVLLFPCPPVRVPILYDCIKSTNYNGYNRHFYVPQFFQLPSKIGVPISLLLSFNFTLWSAGTVNSTIRQVLSFFFIIIRSGRLAEISRSVCMSKSQRSLCVSFSRTDSGSYIYHLFVWSNFNFLYNSQWITLPTKSFLVLNYFCVNLVYSLIIN